MTPEPKPIPVPWRDRPHLSWCEQYDPIMQCSCWSERMRDELADWRARG